MVNTQFLFKYEKNHPKGKKYEKKSAKLLTDSLMMSFTFKSM